MTYSWPGLHPEKLLPADLSLVCWTRMQAEAGQPLHQIIRRKELERQAGSGVFFWGVGNAPALAIQALARTNVPVPVVFSVMKSKPKPEDANAEEVFAWLGYLDECGVERAVPSHAIVLSRARTKTGLKKSHYALICSSESPLVLHDGEAFDLAQYRNAGGKEAPVGASQVTALLKRAPSDSESQTAAYKVAMIADLTDGYWVRLTRPVLLPKNLAEEIAAAAGSAEDWIRLGNRVRQLNGETHQHLELLL